MVRGTPSGFGSDTDRVEIERHIDNDVQKHTLPLHELEVHAHRDELQLTRRESASPLTEDDCWKEGGGFRLKVRRMVQLRAFEVRI